MNPFFRTTIAMAVSGALVFAQAPKPAPAKPAATKPAAPARPAAAPAASALDKIFKMVTLKLPDASVVSSINAAGKSLKVTTDDLIRFKEAGASDNVIVALSNSMNGTPGAAAAPSAPSTAKSAPVAVAPAAATWNTNLSTIVCDAPSSERKRVVAVDEFDYGTVQSQVAAVFGTQVDIGKGILAMFTKRLAEQGKFRIVERQNIKKVMAEQDFGASNRVKQGTQARLGRITGADAILMGTIVTFGRDDKRKSVGGFGIGPRALGGLKIKTGEDKAVVVISFRLVDAESSEVIATGEARGESSRKQNGVDLGALVNRGGGAASVDMTSANFGQTIIGEATMQSVDKLAADLNANEGKIQMRNLDIESRIAEVVGQQIYLSAGSFDGVNKCDRFEIHKIVKEVKDPVTKDVIDMVTEKVGDYVATEVRDRISIGAYNGSAKPEVGYLAKKVQKQ
jgi:curli biogenesis system outer membrane secretion channel CsgG